jgi:hypothetical protein
LILEPKIKPRLSGEKRGSYKLAILLAPWKVYWPNWEMDYIVTLAFGMPVIILHSRESKK